MGIYTRFLLIYLVDPLARPQEYWMKKWIDMTRWIKSKAPGQANTPFPYSSPYSSLLNFIPPYGVLVSGAFDFFTYGELLY